MSKTVDSKVVEMRFDNKNFEKNVKQSMTTLDKLKQALKLDGVTNGLTSIEQRANSLKFRGLADTIDKVADKFSGLSMVGTMAMIRISQSVANAGVNMVKSLSVDNVMSGWQKLQQKANSMSTLISQGYDTSVVEEQLEKLNWFSDETSYNFTDMIDNIAKFTATGKGLEDSVTAMQGIALWAAKSGQNAQKASAAMYQLSQALGAGYMRKEDWKSIQNASMDTAEFRKQTLETAVAMGKVKKVGEDTYQSLLGNKMKFTQQQFAESLTEGQWFTSDVMMEVYKKYAKASDQMKKAIDIMSEDHDVTLTAGQMIKAYDALKNNTFDNFLKEEEIDDEKAIAALKNMVAGFDEFGVSTFRAGQEYRTFNDTIDATKDAVSTKWMNIMETLIGNIDAQKKLWTSVGEQFYDWFAGPLDDLQELLNRWVDMGGRDSLHKALSNIGSAIGAITTPIKEAWDDIFPPMTAKRLTELTNKFKEFTSHLKISGKTAEAIKNTFRAFFSIIKTGLSVIKTLGKALFTLIGVFRPLGELIMSAVGFLSKWVDKTAEAARNSKWLSDSVNIVVNVIKKFANAIENMIKKFLNYESFMNFFNGLFNLIKNIGLAIGKFIGGLIHSGDLNQFMKMINSGLLGALIYQTTSWVKSLKEITKGFKDTIIETLNQLKDVLGAYEKDVNAKALLKIAIAVGILASSMWLLSGIDGVALTKAIGAMTMLVAELLVAFKILTKLGKDQKILLRNSIALISLSASLLILSAAIKNIASLKFSDMITGLTGLAGAMLVMVAAIKRLPDDGKTKKKTKGLIGLSISLLILSIALKKIGNMKLTEIIKSLITMFIATKVMVGTINSINPEGAIRKALSLVVLANAMVVLGLAMKILGSLSWSEIGRGLAAMGGALAILTIAMNHLSTGNRIASKLGSFASAGAKFKGGGVNFGMSGSSGNYESFKSSQGGALSKSFALLGATMSLVILGGAMKLLATMNWSDIGRSLAAMGGALTILVVAMRILGSSVGGALAGASSLMIASAALISLALGLKLLGSIHPDKIVKSLVALAAALTILGVAGYLLKGVAINLLVVAGAVALFGVAAATLGVGLGLIATGISALAVALSAGATAIVAGLSAIILGIVGLIPEIVKTLGLAIAEFCKVIIECAPLIAQAIGTVLLEAVKMLKDFVPPIVTAILDLFIQTIRAVTDRVPELIMSIAELLSAIFRGFMEALQILDAKTLLGGIACIGMLAIIFQLLAGLAITAPLAALGVVAFGALLVELMSVLGIVAKFKNMVTDIKDAGDVLEAVGTDIGRFVGSIIGGFGLGVSDTMPQIAMNLSEFINNLQPFLNGVSKIKPDMTQGVQALANAIIILTGANVLKSMSSLFTWFTGDNSFEKFGKEISSLGTGMKDFAKNLGSFSNSQVTSISAACDAISALAKAAKQIPNEGGLWAGIVGDNGIGKWSAYLPQLGTNLNEFVKNLGTFSSSQIDAVASAGNAIISLAEAAKQIPNEGGLWSGIVGDNGIGKFSDQLPLTGKCIAEMAKSLQGFTSESVDVIRNAGESIAALAVAASKIPNSGGLVSLFTGGNDISIFAFKLPIVGSFLKKFITNLGSFDKAAVDKSKFAGDAIAALAVAASKIPNSGGLVSLFTGDNDIAAFAYKFPIVGTNLAKFVENLGTFNEAQVTTTDCAGRAISALATAASNIPNVGPLAKLFVGESDISQFSGKFPGVATNLAKFVENLGTFNEAQVTTTDCAGRAIKALGDAAHNIPAEDGLWQKIAGKQSLAEFSKDLPKVGSALAGFVKNLIANGDFTSAQVTTIDAACKALKTLASVSSAFPKTGGAWQWLTGENDVSKHASKFPAVAEGLKGFTDKLKNYNKSNVDSVNAATDALKTLAKIDNIDFSNLAEASKDAPTIGKNLSSFITKLASSNKDTTELAKTNADSFVELINKFSSINGDNIKKISDGLKNIGETGINKFIESLSGNAPATKVSQAIRDLITKLIDTMETKRSDVEAKFASIVMSAINKLNESTMIDKMKTAGKNFAQGFADGIISNKYLATNAGTELGNAAYKAAKRSIDAHSPSKKAHKLGNFFGLGFINGIHEYTSNAYGESYNMADEARKGLTNAISKVNDILNDDRTNQPTIRPVLDLTDVESGAGKINGLFKNVNIGGNLNAITVGMRSKGQNGTANDVVSAINKLGSNLGSTGDTYNINGITYDDQSSVSEAIQTLIRAANIERRS
jgi:tape measure domain-containing protein